MAPHRTRSLGEPRIVSSLLSLLACVARLTFCFPLRVSHAHSPKEKEEDPSLAVCTCRFSLVRCLSPYSSQPLRNHKVV